MCEDFANRDWSWIGSADVDHATDRFTKEILQTVEARVPTKLVFAKLQYILSITRGAAYLFLRSGRQMAFPRIKMS